MIYRIFPDKDTFITNSVVNGVAATGSNSGASETLQIFKIAAISGAVGAYATASIARALMHFDLSALASLTSSGQVPSSGVVYRLHLADLQHNSTLPKSFDIEVQSLTQDWDEGTGIDVDQFSDSGLANWIQPKTGQYWSVAGSSGSGEIFVQHFDSGHEDLDIDVTNLVSSWLSGTISNNGVMIRLSSTLESDGSDYYVKMFSSRETYFPVRTPYIEARWDDSLKDDRNNFVFDYSGSLFLYNRVRGAYTNLSTGSNPLLVSIADSSGTLTTVTASWTGLMGVYSASFVLATGSYSGSIFYDIWHTSAKTFMTGTFFPTDSFSSTSVAPFSPFTQIVNLRERYIQSDQPRLNVYIRLPDYNPAVVLTSSIDVPNGLVATEGYYQIVEDTTDRLVIPFGTGSTQETRLSYDLGGNYFKFRMDSLPPKSLYRIQFLFNVDGQSIFVDDGFTFRLE